MTNVVNVKFRQAGKAYYFDPGELELKSGDFVIVETSRGIEFGTVTLGNHEIQDSAVVQPLRPVIRKAEAEDIIHEADNREKEKSAFEICHKKISEHGLEMKLIDCEYTFDNSKVLFYFTADGRVDFRELVKDLAAIFRVRIELRQVGVRDETKLLGGLGVCGRDLCCHAYLSDFVPVSIKMAKEQKLSLNPTKISGVCGRLMCCLKNEEEVYRELNKKLPNVGDRVTAADGMKGDVQSISTLRQMVKVVVELPGDEKEVREYHADELKLRVRKKDKNRLQDEQGESELQELEAMELQDKRNHKEKRDDTTGKRTEDLNRGDERNYNKFRKNHRENHRENNKENIKENIKENHRENHRENQRDNPKDNQKDHQKRNENPNSAETETKTQNQRKRFRKHRTSGEAGGHVQE